MSNLKELEHQKKEIKEAMAQRDVAIRLAKNRDFDKLITQGFCKDEAARLVHLSADPALSKEQREDALNMAQAGGHLRRFLSAMVTMANTQEGNLVELEEAIEEARRDEDNNAIVDSEGASE